MINTNKKKINNDILEYPFNEPDKSYSILDYSTT